MNKQTQEQLALTPAAKAVPAEQEGGGYDNEICNHGSGR